MDIQTKKTSFAKSPLFLLLLLLLFEFSEVTKLNDKHIPQTIFPKKPMNVPNLLFRSAKFSNVWSWLSGLPYDWYNELIFSTFPLISLKIYAINFPQNEVKNCKYYYTYYKSLAHTIVLYDVANTTTSSFHFSITTETD